METPPHRVAIDDTLDLHTFAPRDVPSVVEEYVNEAHRHGLTQVRFIHGRGIGVQRRAVHTVLERHPLVVELWDAPESRLGATVARLAVGETPVGSESAEVPAADGQPAGRHGVARQPGAGGFAEEVAEAGEAEQVGQRSPRGTLSSHRGGRGGR